MHFAFLGSSGAIPGRDRDTTSVVFVGERDAHTLIHEATFSERRPRGIGAHSTAAQAGECAARAGVRRLILTHIDAGLHGLLDEHRDEARARFPGEVEIARELVPYQM